MTRAIYRVGTLPDPAYSPFQALAQGDVRTLAFQSFERLLRLVAHMPSGSLSFEILFDYRPIDRVNAAQSRLELYLITDTQDEDIASALEARLMGGPLNQLYELERTPDDPSDTNGLRAACDVLRGADLIEPLHGGEFNSIAPRSYLSVQCFEANPDNDYVVVENDLSHFSERVVISARVQPADISEESAAFTEYTAQLQAINRGRDIEEDDFVDVDPDGTGRHAMLSPRNDVRPMHEPDPLANELSSWARQFSRTLRPPNLLFHIRVLAECEATALSVASDVAESAFEQGSYDLVSSRAGDPSFTAALAGLREARVHTVHYCEARWSSEQVSTYRGLLRLPHLSPVDGLIGAFRLPVASSSSPCCIRRNTDPAVDDDANDILIGTDQEPRVSATRRATRRLRIESVGKHIGIFGMSGYGKTTAVMNLMLQLWALGIPFMALEPVKTEYRVLKLFHDHPNERVRNLARSLQVYSVGDETVSPLRFSPLEHLPEISDEEHIEQALSWFRAVTPLEGPLEGLLGEGLEDVFEMFPDPERPPLLADLLASCERCLTAKRYSGETHSDLRGALDVRLGAQVRRVPGRIFQTRRSVPSIAQLMSSPSIVELDRLTVEHACFMAFSLLGGIHEQLRVEPAPDRPVRFVLIIEEAHTLAARNTNTTTPAGTTDPKAHAADRIERLLAVLRGLGVGVVIVDQSPGKLASGVLANTSTKLAFRTVLEEDREALGAAMLLGPKESEEIARLRMGEAFVMTEEYQRPRRLWTVNLHEELNLSNPPLNERLIPYIRDDDWHRQAERERRVAELTRLAQETERFLANHLCVMREVATLSTQLARILRIGGTPEGRERAVGRILDRASSLRQNLISTRTDFMRTRYRPLIGREIPSDAPAADLRPLQARLVRWSKEATVTDTKTCLRRIGVLIERCRRQTGV